MLFIALQTLSCGNRSSAGAATPSEYSIEAMMPQVPSLITNASDRHNYLSEHFWDNYDFADTVLMASDSIMGISVAGYISLLGSVGEQTAQSSVSRMLDKCLVQGLDVFNDFTHRLEDYLYDPNSPVRNEQLYVHILRYIVYSPDIEDIYKSRAEYQLNMALKNNIGEAATDFEYTTLDGKTSNMYNIDSEYIVLFFNDPDCHDCERVKAYAEASSVFNVLSDRDLLAMLAICIEANVDAWRAANYPDIFINGYDQNQAISSEGLYDLKAVPTIYLLDKDKNVILKDSPVEQIEAWLSQNI